MNRDVLTRVAPVLCLVLLAIASGLFGVWWRHQQSNPIAPHLTVIFPNIGDSNCTFIETPEGQTILIGTGAAKDSPVVLKLLHDHQIRHIDLLILASPDEETIGGVPQLLSGAIPVRLIWDNSVASGSSIRRAAFTAIRAHAVPVRIVNAGATIEVGSMPARLGILWPPEHGPSAQTDPIICRLDYGNTSFLLNGNSTGEAEEHLISDAGHKLNSTEQYGILQTSDHGADTGTSLEMLRLSTPETAIISCSTAHPPALGTLHRLEAAGAGIWRTDTQGTITIIADGTQAPVVTAENG